ncbi:hypothetical protein Cgig2_019669 [Carnegiea gigantea]|uniref:GATA-type domain-containing protein n=1 Tax=Carnegiea gigantea TaxID=171969 RepID=A0A9Q1KJ75_9CARY|nr:hypothetical protein Cgig2_019669 [Carnegiea gigantea]
MCSSCGSYNQYCTHQEGAPSFSYWPNSSTHYQNSSYCNNYNDDQDYSASSFASSPNSVDCTLSLGTPSTRYENHTNYEPMSSSGSKPTPHRNSVSSFCWDLLHPNKQSSSKSHRHHSNGGDPLLARRCANCDTTSTPLWRNGPRGPKSLCNACGIRYKKEERRAAAASTTAAHNAGMMMVDPQWAHQYPQANPQKMQMQMQCFGDPNHEFRFMEDDRGSEAGVQFLSWLAYDRPSGLVHDFTR